MPYTALRNFLTREGGAVSFERFMHEALYGEDGYYRRNISEVGRGGDFSTSATLSPKLGEALANWLQASWKEDGFCRNVIEIGPGSGQLLKAVHDALPWSVRRRLHWHLVETSPVLQNQQRQTLGKGKFSWHNNMGPALEACEGKAWIFSNELPDAFPVQLLEKSAESAWQEIWLGLTAEGALVETARPWAPEPAILGKSRETLLASEIIPTGQRIEFPAAWAGWMSRWRPLWKSGRLLTIDYGGDLSQMYHRRVQGTLRAYMKHQRRTGLELYQNMGRQDLTADVCFEDLVLWGREIGLETLAVQSQAAFLKRFVAKWADTREEHYLLDESGAGGAFQVLEQRSR